MHMILLVILTDCLTLLTDWLWGTACLTHHRRASSSCTKCSARFCSCTGNLSLLLSDWNQFTASSWILRRASGFHACTSLLLLVPPALPALSWLAGAAEQAAEQAADRCPPAAALPKHLCSKWILLYYCIQYCRTEAVALQGIGPVSWSSTAACRAETRLKSSDQYYQFFKSVLDHFHLLWL